MPRTRAFEVEGVIMEVLANGTCRVELANGHRLIGFLAGRAKLRVGSLRPGDKVSLVLSPCDLSVGRMVV